MYMISVRSGQRSRPEVYYAGYAPPFTGLKLNGRQNV